jgi:hypothetical protein
MQLSPVLGLELIRGTKGVGHLTQRFPLGDPAMDLGPAFRRDFEGRARRNRATTRKEGARMRRVIDDSHRRCHGLTRRDFTGSGTDGIRTRDLLRDRQAC